MNETPKPSSVLTRPELDILADLNKLIKKVGACNSLDHFTQTQMLKYLRDAGVNLLGSATERMIVGETYIMTKDPDEQPAKEDTAGLGPVTIADLKRRNELKVSSRGEQRCQDTPSKSEPGITTHTSQSANSSAPPNAKSAVSETKQKST